jgi:hypothetical protein
VAALSRSYIFVSLNKEDLDDVVNSMEIVQVSAGENIVTQGYQLVLLLFVSFFLI